MRKKAIYSGEVGTGLRTRQICEFCDCGIGTPRDCWQTRGIPSRKRDLLFSAWFTIFHLVSAESREFSQHHGLLSASEAFFTSHASGALLRHVFSHILAPGSFAGVFI